MGFVVVVAVVAAVARVGRWVAREALQRSLEKEREG